MLAWTSFQGSVDNLKPTLFSSFINKPLWMENCCKERTCLLTAAQEDKFLQWSSVRMQLSTLQFSEPTNVRSLGICWRTNDEACHDMATQPCCSNLCTCLQVWNDLCDDISSLFSLSQLAASTYVNKCGEISRRNLLTSFPCRKDLSSFLCSLGHFSLCP